MKTNHVAMTVAALSLVAAATAASAQSMAEGKSMMKPIPIVTVLHLPVITTARPGRARPARARPK